MTNFWRRAFGVVVLVLAVGLGVAAWYYFSRANVLTVAVGPANFDDADFINAWGRDLAAEGGFVRLKVLQTSGSAESFEKLKKGEAKLAVGRTDHAASERIRAVALLHSDPVIIVAPEKAKIDNFAASRARRWG